MEQTIRRGGIKLEPPIVKPHQRDRFGKWRPSEEGKSPCHYCLESLPRLEDGNQAKRGCPICRHTILVNLLGIPVHLFNRPQQWELLANELEFIWNWEYEVFKGYRHCVGQFRSENYSHAKAVFERLNDSQFAVLNLREEFLEAEGELDALIAGYLGKRWNGGGGLGSDLLAGREWRERAKHLSREAAGKREITELQIEMVSRTSWGAFGSFDEKMKVLRLVESRRIQS